MIGNVLRLTKKYTIIPIIFVLFMLFSIISKDFFDLQNLSNILLQSSMSGVMAIGMTFLMINGYFDLSVGTVMGLCANLVIGLQKFGLFAAILISILVAVVFGLINGFLTAKVKINAFIVTLSSMIGARGLTYVYSREMSLVGKVPAFNDFSAQDVLGIPSYVLIFLFFLIISSFVLKRTMHGRNTYAVGGNGEASFNAGINADRTTIINFVICSFMAGVGGIMQAARMNASTPTIGWPDTNLTVISCVVLGGTSLKGGYGGMVFTLGGTLAIFMIKNALNLINVQSYYNSIVTGMILIIIILNDKLLHGEK